MITKSRLAASHWQYYSLHANTVAVFKRLILLLNITVNGPKMHMTKKYRKYRNGHVKNDKKKIRQG